MTQAKNSILCPNCRRLISKDEPRCPYCNLSHPGSWWMNNPIFRLFRDSDQALKALIGVNIGMYILSVLLQSPGQQGGFSPLSLFAPDNQSLFLLGATGTIPIERLGRWWSLISASYLHGSILHIGFNMVALYQIAPLIFKEYGIQRTIVIYTLSGVGGYLVSFLAGIPFTIGASAAVCGLIGSALYYGKRRGGVYGRAIYSQLGGWAIGIMIFGFIVPGINNWAHGGGMATGALLGFLLGFQEQRRENITHKMLGGFCLLITATILIWASVTGIFYHFMG